MPSGNLQRQIILNALAIEPGLHGMPENATLLLLKACGREGRHFPPQLLRKAVQLFSSPRVALHTVRNNLQLFMLGFSTGKKSGLERNLQLTIGGIYLGRTVNVLKAGVLESRSLRADFHWILSITGRESLQK